MYFQYKVLSRYGFGHLLINIFSVISSEEIRLPREHLA